MIINTFLSFQLNFVGEPTNLNEQNDVWAINNMLKNYFKI